MAQALSQFLHVNYMTGTAFWREYRFSEAVKRPFAFVRSSFLAVLTAFLIIDAVLIITNVAAVLATKMSLISGVPEMLKVTGDHTIPENFNYIKWAVIAAALVWISLRDRKLPPLLWSLVFAMILSDDALQVHENLGGWLSQVFDIPDDTLVYGRDIGELSVFGVMGLVTLAIFGFLLTRRDIATRVMNLRYMLIVIALGFFGVGLDIVHSIIEHLTGASSFATLVQQTFGMLEDGGEMVVGSIALALTLAGDPVSGPAVEKS